jgi:hypothetical protein
MKKISLLTLLLLLISSSSWAIDEIWVSNGRFQKILDQSQQAKAAEAPDGAIYTNERVFRPNPPQANPPFDYALFWYQVVTKHQKTAGVQKQSGVVIRYAHITAKDKDGKIISKIDFEGNSTLSPNSGGLYPRNPQWFKNDIHTPIVDQQVYPYGLEINTSSTPDMIVRWWTERFRYDPTTKYELEMQVKIVGDVGLQIGADYWKGQTSSENGWEENCVGTNNCEAFVSDWYYDTKNSFITIKKEM